jgi:hypothetical protein
LLENRNKHHKIIRVKKNITFRTIYISCNKRLDDIHTSK